LFFTLIGNPAFSSDKNLYEIIELLNKSAIGHEYFNILKHSNPTQNDFILEWKDLSKINQNYTANFGVGWLKKGRLYIYVNNSCFNDSDEAIATLLAGLSVHVDSADSINEEVYSALLQGIIWNEFVTENPSLKMNDSELVNTLNYYRNILLTEADPVIYLINLYSKYYSNLPKESKGFSDEGLNNLSAIFVNRNAVIDASYSDNPYDLFNSMLNKEEEQIIPYLKSHIDLEKKKDPIDTNKISYFYFLLGYYYENKLNNFKLAIENYQKALDLEYTNPIVITQLANL
jgi:hypothetical protein